MSTSNEIAQLNQLLSDIKVLMGSLSILDKATFNKDQVSIATALDAINFRVSEINKIVNNLNLRNPTNLMELPINEIWNELSKPNPDTKVLHSLFDDQIDTVRKTALSEILTLSIE